MSDQDSKSVRLFVRPTNCESDSALRSEDTEAGWSEVALSIPAKRAANRHSKLMPALRSLCQSRSLFGSARLHTVSADEYDRVVASTPSQIVV